MTRKTYDERGNWTNCVYFNTNGLATPNKNGYVSTFAKWDERSNQIETACFDEYGKPTLDRSVGSHMNRMAYDERWNLTNGLYLGTNGLPILTKSGYSSINARWDDNGNKIEIAYFDARGDPTIDQSQGSHKARMTYDERGNIINAVFLGTNGLPMLHMNGYASLSAKWDERGNQIELAFFGTNGKCGGTITMRKAGKSNGSSWVKTINQLLVKPVTTSASCNTAQTER
jgi:YD repeat-containing protein